MTSTSGRVSSKQLELEGKRYGLVFTGLHVHGIRDVTCALVVCYRQFYGVRDDYPVNQLMVRCQAGQKRNLYFVSPAIKQLVQNNDDKIRVSLQRN